MSTHESQKRPRLSDDETARRMLDAGRRMVVEGDLALELGQIRLEEVIAAAGVSRTAAYRHWRHKDEYYFDLLLLLGVEFQPLAMTRDDGGLATALAVLDTGLEQASTGTARRRLLVDLSRILGEHFFRAITETRRWTVHLAVQSAIVNLPDPRQRERLREAVTASLTADWGTLGDVYAAVLGILGHRFRAEFAAPSGRSSGAVIVSSSVLLGLALTEKSLPENGTRRFTADMFGVGPMEWTAPGLSFASILVPLWEEDPEQSGEWDAQEIAARRARVRGMLDAQNPG